MMMMTDLIQVTVKVPGVFSFSKFYHKYYTVIKDCRYSSNIKKKPTNLNMNTWLLVQQKAPFSSQFLSVYFLATMNRIRMIRMSNKQIQMP